MNEQKYYPMLADIVLMRDDSKGILADIKRWGLKSEYDPKGEWGHVAMVCAFATDGTVTDIPLVVESIGRGVMIRPLAASNRRYVRVLRYGPSAAPAKMAAAKAISLATEPDSFYGYFDIPFALIPRLLLYKLTGKRYKWVYRHNGVFICSEVPDEAFGYTFFPDELEPPLPGDYNSVKSLSPAYEGVLSV